MKRSLECDYLNPFYTTLDSNSSQVVPNDGLYVQKMISITEKDPLKRNTTKVSHTTDFWSRFLPSLVSISTVQSPLYLVHWNRHVSNVSFLLSATFDQVPLRQPRPCLRYDPAYLVITRFCPGPRLFNQLISPSAIVAYYAKRPPPQTPLISSA